MKCLKRLHLEVRVHSSTLKLCVIYKNCIKYANYTCLFFENKMKLGILYFLPGHLILII